MKAIAVRPGQAGSIHLREVPLPALSSVPGGRGVLVRVLRVGVDGTDKEIIAAEYGAAPAGDEFLIIGHESFGVVEEVGPEVREIAPGDFVVATVRRPGSSFYDTFGLYDMSTDDVYLERGINLLHGYLTEYYVDEPEYLVSVPAGLQEAGVLLEPTSIVEKGLLQAYEIQRRLRFWRPRKAAVLGAGTVGLLATLILRVKGVQVCAFGLQRPPYLNAELLQSIGACYHSVQDLSLTEAAGDHGPFDLIFEATGYSPLAFEAMNVLGKNGVLVLASVTGGGRSVQVPADRINLGFVLGNKVMVGTVNANREYFEAGVGDLSQAQLRWPGWLPRLLTHPVDGLENHREMARLLTDEKGAIKVFVKVGEA